MSVKTPRYRPDRGRVNKGDGKCRYCEGPVPKGRRTFCSKTCVHEHRLRSDGTYLRSCLRRRDHGVCAGCGTDTERLRAGLVALYRINTVMYAEEVAKLGYPKFRTGHTLWAADHVVPVWMGGGQTGLDNLQTLCLKCHHTKTALEAKARASRKRSGRAANDKLLTRPRAA